MSLNSSEILHIILEAVILIVGTFGNAFVIAIFVLDKKLMKKKLNVYLLALTIIDLIHTCPGIILSVAVYFKVPTDRDLCVASVGMIFAIRMIAIFGKVMIAFDRYSALSQPIAYYQDNSKIGAVVVVIFYWMLGLFIGYIPLIFDWTQDYEKEDCHFPGIISGGAIIMWCICGMTIPFIILTVLYCVIYFKIRKMNRVPVTVASSSCKLFKRQRRDIRVTSNIMIIVGVYLFSIMPFNIAYFVMASSTWGHNDLIYYFVKLSHISSAVNPFFYAFRLEEFRKSCKKILNISMFNNRKDHDHDDSHGSFNQRVLDEIEVRRNLGQTRF